MNKALVSGSSLAGSVRTGIRQGFFAYFTLFKIMVPVYIIIAILKKLDIVAWLAGVFSPYMKFFGLPGEAALVIVTGWTVNLYGAIAALAGLNFSIRQVTILGAILGISHSLVMETAIISRMKGRPWSVLLLRLSIGLASGFLLNLILPVRL